MLPHERYELLCALAATRRLEAADQLELHDHIRTCDDCRVALREFREVIEEVSSEPAEILAISSSETNERDAARFAGYARSQGIHFSPDAEALLAPHRGAPRPSRRLLPRLAYAALVLVAAVVPAGLVFKYRGNAPSVRGLQSTPTVTAIPVAQVQLKTSADQVPHRETVLQARLIDAVERNKEIPQLKEQLQAKTTEQEKLNSSWSAKVADRDAKITQLQASAADAQKQLATAQSTITSLTDRTEKTLADLVVERVRANNLADELNSQKAAVDQEHELSAATREVRELMGARRLFMVDVYDGEDRARANRSFGRVFYTEGKSLIFYAFDLDKLRTPKRVSFQAWGQRGKDPASIKHLGDFYIDDAEQKRWVMKVDDPQKLKAVDAIFVTVEPTTSARKPTGTKLLYAYLGGQPNHP